MKNNIIIQVSEVSSQNDSQEDKSNNENVVDPPPKNISSILYIMIIFAACIPLTCLYTLIPRSNSIFYPQIWYEFAIVFTTFASFRLATTQLLEVVIYLNVNSLKSAWMWLKHFLRILLIVGTLYLSTYLIWTVYLGYRHPMPFQILNGTIAWLVSLPMLFVWLPKELVEEKDFRQKIYFFILYDIVFFIVHQHFTGLSILFGVLPDNFQWAMSFIIPLSREFVSYVLSKIIDRISGGDNEASKVLLDTTVLLSYGMFVAIQLDSANDVTVYMILTVEFFLHLFNCFEVIRLERKIETQGSERIRIAKQEKVKEIILSEIVEAIIPILYALAFTTAYYGPNGTLIGNVRNGWWGYKEKEDIERFYLVMFQMFSIDFCCIIASVIFLKVFGQINLIHELNVLLREHWFILMVKLSLSMLFFGYNEVNGGMDFTLNFEWLTQEGRSKLIYNATDLTLDEKKFLLQNEGIS